MSRSPASAWWPTPRAIDALVAALAGAAAASPPGARRRPGHRHGRGRRATTRDAIVEPETGFVAADVDLAVVARHTEWPIPLERPAFAQGAIAGVPARLSLVRDDGRATLITAAAYADELAERLGLPP